MALLVIDGKTYVPVPITRVSMVDGYRLEQELKREGFTPWRWLEIVQIAMDPASGDEHSQLLTMVAVWAARRGAGEKVGFVQANEYSILDLGTIDDPEPDEGEPEGKG